MNLDELGEKPKRGIELSDDGELIHGFEVDESTDEKPKRRLPDRRIRIYGVIVGVIVGMLLTLLAYNLIPGLRPVDHKVYPADDRPRVVATPEPKPANNAYCDLSEIGGAMGCMGAYMEIARPLVMTVLGLGMGIYIVKAVASKFS